MKSTDPYGTAGDPEEWKPQKPVISTEDFGETEDGLLIPSPSGKEVRQIFFFQGMIMQVQESQEEIRDRIDTARLGGAHFLSFTDALYGNVISVPVTALDHISWIGEAWVDMTAAREQIKEQDRANKMRSMGIQTVQMPNRAARRH